MYDKEKIYDEEISPLITQIIEICKRENLPMAAQFYLRDETEDDGPMYCSTVILPAKKEMNAEAYEQMKCVSNAMKYGPSGKPFVMAAAIRTGGNE